MILGGALTSTSASYPVPARRLHPARIRGRSVEPGRDRRRRRRERTIARTAYSAGDGFSLADISAHIIEVFLSDRIDWSAHPHLKRGSTWWGAGWARPPSGRRTVVIRPAYGLRRPHPSFDTGYKQLTEYTVGRSLDHVQRGTTVVDIGCSSGRTLAEIRRENQVARPDVNYLGIDIEPRFRRRWERYQFVNLRFEIGDALSLKFDNVSFASLHERDGWRSTRRGNGPPV